jgi:hypothetical protein
MRLDPEHLRPEDVGEEVHFEIAQDAFKGPPRCCGRKALRVVRVLQVGRVRFPYNQWRCPRCKKEYVDWDEAGRIDQLLLVRRMLKARGRGVSRKLEFGRRGAALRFPPSEAHGWKAGAVARVTRLRRNEFLVSIQAR